MVYGDEWLAATAGSTVDHSAASESHLEGLRIEGLEQCDAFIDDQRYTFTKLQRATQKRICAAVHLQCNPMAFAALVDGLLDAVGVGLGFVSGS